MLSGKKCSKASKIMDVSQYNSWPITQTGILRYVRPNVSLRNGRGIMLGTVTYSYEIFLRRSARRILLVKGDDCKQSG